MQKRDECGREGEMVGFFNYSENSVEKGMGMGRK